MTTTGHEPAHPADHPGPFVLVEDLDHPRLADDDRHHLERVLRVRPGAPVVLGDGAGAWRPGRFGDELEATGEVERQARPWPPIAVGFALTKAGKPDLVVQKLTELGVDRIVPFRADRSVVRWDDAQATKAHRRLVSVARSAAVQSHRPWLATVEPVTDLTALLGEPEVALAERTGAPLASSDRLVLVGPEGGWSPAEREQAAAAGARSVAVARHVLRAETAAITVGALIVGLRDGGITPRGAHGA